MQYFTKEEEEKLEQGLTPVLSQKEFFGGGRCMLDNLIGFARTAHEAIAMLKAVCDDIEDGCEVETVEIHYIEYKDSANDQNVKLIGAYLPVYKFTTEA